MKFSDLDNLFLINIDYLCILIRMASQCSDGACISLRMPRRVRFCFHIMLNMNTDNASRTTLMAPTLANRLGTLLMTFFVMIIIVGLSKGVIDYLAGGSVRNAFLVSSCLQNILAFIFPAWLAAYLCSTDASRYLGLSQPVRSMQFIGVIALLVIMTPAMDFIVNWNSGMKLPESMHSLEQTMRDWEEAAARTTAMILGDSSVWGLVSGVLIVGLLTGFAEEMFFRAGIQRAMTSAGINAHVAIWTTAVIFSAVHFQFFGFIPRVLLGAVFGYLYMYTGSVLVSAWAHALNNSTVVISAWLMARGITSVEIERMLDFNGSAWAVGASVILTFAFIYLFGRRVFRRPAVN